jgi:hypothetical protein
MNVIPKTNKEETVYKDTVYAKLRRALYNAVNSNKYLQETQWDENGRCHMVQAYGDRGIIATMQKKANNKGWVVFFSLSILTENNSTPFIRDLKVRLTINETPDGVRLLWFVNGKPQWRMESSQMAFSNQFHRTGQIVQEVMKQIKDIYSPEDFIPILKYMIKPGSGEFAPYGLSQRWMKKLSGGTNPKQILNKIYGKDGQDGLSKNAFGGLTNIRSFVTFAVTAEVVRYLKSFPSSFFDKIIIDEAYNERLDYIGLPHQDVTHIQYFIKYFNHSKIQQDFINAINHFNLYQYPDEQISQGAELFFQEDIWREAVDAGRMLKEIKNRAVRRNIIAFKGTVQETHDLITLENAKLVRENKQIKYTDIQLMLDDQEVADNIISVLPKTTFDLILWGSQQHNCIGSYGEQALRNSTTVIVGFKDKTTGNWIGHAQLRTQFGFDITNWEIVQLRGKYNHHLDESDDIAIRMFLNDTVSSWNKALVSEISFT